jgi:hypothetical protein
MYLYAPGPDPLCHRVAVAACGRDLLNYLRHWRCANCLFPQSSFGGKLPTDCAKAMGNSLLQPGSGQSPRVP